MFTKTETGKSSFSNHTINIVDVDSMKIEPDELLSNGENLNKNDNRSREGIIQGLNVYVNFLE